MHVSLSFAAGSLSEQANNAEAAAAQAQAGISIAYITQIPMDNPS
jgi:hypothetical protein